jgi:DNA polymerase III psi subunit
MSLDQLQLDPYLLARIYTQPIVPGKSSPAPQAPAAPPAALPKVRFLGENQKNIVLLIQNDHEAYLNEELFNLLTNILNACKLGMQDIALVNISQYPAMPFTSWQTAVPMKQTVLFGISPASMGLEDFPPYNIMQVSGCQLLYSQSLLEISQDKTLKAKLWGGLKQLLNV